MNDQQELEPTGGDARSTSDLTQAVIDSTRWIAAARVLTEVLLFVTMVALARMIPPAEFGRFSIVLFMQELSIGMIGGFGNALVQRPAARREHVQGAFAIVLGLQAVVILATVLVLAPFVFGPIFGSATAGLIQLAAPGWALAALAVIPQALLQRRLDFARLAQIQLASVLVGAAVSVVLATFADLDAEALVLGSIAAAIVGTALSLISAPPPLPALRRRVVRELTPYGVPASLAAISWAGFRNADYAIVGARLGAASAGFYWRAFQLSVEYQKKISVVMSQIAFPLLSRASSTEDMFALRSRMVRILTVAVFPLLAGLVVLAPTVIPWVFGPAWEPAIVPAQILTVAGAATLVIDAVGATLMAAGRAQALLAYGWGHFAVYAATVALVASQGLVAVCIAAAGVHLAFLVIAYVVLLQGHIDRPLRRLWEDVAPASTCSLALIGVALPATSAASAAHLPVSIHVAVVGVAAAFAYLLVLRVAFSAEWRNLAGLLRRLVPVRVMRAAPPWKRPAWSRAA